MGKLLSIIFAQFRILKRTTWTVLRFKFLTVLLCISTSAVIWTSFDNQHLFFWTARATRPISDRNTSRVVQVQWSPLTALPRLQSNHGNQTNPALTAEQKKVLQELEDRRLLVEKVCARSRKIGKMQKVLLNADSRLAYCFVPKTGCTFWKRVFTYLSIGSQKHLKGFSRSFTSPFDIPRLNVHIHTETRGMEWTRARNRTQDHLRFMFTRDPYTRLWSDYLDKFHLPDFWARFGRRILSRRSPRPSRDVLNCGDGVTFQEFVEFALHFEEPHWSPVSITCDPCKFRPHVIGKMETYARDAKAILDYAGLNWILEGFDNQKHVKNEVETLVEYNFQKIHKHSPQLGRKCITDQELAAKLWTVFQYNGYISADMQLVAIPTFSKASFIEQVLLAIEDSSRNGTKYLKQQKANVLENAFRQLPNKLLKEIERRYALDFEMFDYSPWTFM